MYDKNRYWTDQIRDSKEKRIKINPSGWVHTKTKL